MCQIYAPLSSVCPGHDRTLYLFGCPQPPCWNTQHSWTCLRDQRLDQDQADPGERPVSSGAGNVTDWLGEADDWGDDDDELNGNLSLAHNSRVQCEAPEKTVVLPLSTLTLTLSRPQAGEAGAETRREEPAVAEIEMEDTDGPVSVDVPQLRNISRIMGFL